MSKQASTETASSAHPRPRPMIIAAAIVVVGAIGVFFALRSAPTPEERALDLVRRLETAFEGRDFEAAHALVDYRARLAEVLGELWESGDEGARAELERLTRGMLVDTTEKLWPACCHGRPMEHSIKSSAEDVIWVESRPTGPDAPNFIWRYRVSGRQQAWRITQRDYVKDRTPNDTTRFWPMARKAVAMKLGREPNLSEFQANLLAVMPTLRVRTFFVPEKLSTTQSPKKSDAPSHEDTAP